MDTILEIAHSSKVAREWLNGGLLPINLSLVIVIGIFLWRSWRDHVGPGPWWKGWGVPTACALFWIFFADGLRAGLVWALLRVETGQRPPFEIRNYISPETINVGLSVAGIIGVLASLRCVYLFTPPRWGHWGWFSTMLLTAAWLAFIHQ